MKKIAALILALIVVLSAAALAAAPEAFVGHWEDTVSQRAWLRIDQNWDEDFDVRVFWGSGVSENAEWTMTATYDPTVGQIVYNNGTSRTVTYDADGNVMSSQTNYTGDTGIIWIDSDGFLHFLCGDSALNECQFVWTGN